MNHWQTQIKKIFRLLFVSFTVFAVTGQTTNDNPANDLQLPDSFTQYLDSLRKADNLEEWLIGWMEYLQDEPGERVSLLYTAESQVWRQPVTGDERLAWFDLLTNQGYYQLYRGNIVRSIDSYEKAYRYGFENLIPGAEEDLLEYVLKPLGNNYTRLGDYDRAFFIQEKALSLAEAKEDSASFYNNLAITARSQGRLESAQAYAEKGLQIVNRNSALHGLLLSTAADIFFRQKKINDAEQKISQAIGILKNNFNDKSGDAPYWLLGAYRVRGDVFREKNNLTAALQSFREASLFINKMYNGQKRREKAQVLVSMGEVLLKMRQPHQSLEEYDHALSVLLPAYKSGSLPAAGDLYAENTLLDALHGKAECLEALNDKEEALEYYLLFMTAQRKLRYEFFSKESKQQQQRDYRRWVESAMDIAFELWSAGEKAEYAEKLLLISEMSKAQVLLEELMTNLQFSRIKSSDTMLSRQIQLMQAIVLSERESILEEKPGVSNSKSEGIKKELQYELSLIRKQVKEKYPELSNYISEEFIPSAKDLLQHISSSTAVIEFFSGEKNIYIIHADQSGVKAINKLENAGQIRQAVKDFVQHWFQQGSAKMMNEPQQYYKDAFQFYRRFWNDSLTLKMDRCLIIPDGVIGFLPFDALVTDSVYRPGIAQWPFLVKEKNIFFSYSLQTLRQQKQNAADNKSFAGFFISFDSSTNASLPAVKKEYSSLKQVIKGDFFIETNASLEAFKNSLGKVNLLHISTHSFLQGRENTPTLQLADDRFFLFELYGKFFQPQLVVLSACRTGHGMLAEGEGIISLARGFTATGAGGIVAGLWNMHDESVAELMEEFYRQLKKNNHPSAALHAAKTEWLKREVQQSISKLPYYWAGLIYAGNDQPVDISTKRSIPIVWWIAGTALLLIFGITVVLRTRKKN